MTLLAGLEAEGDGDGIGVTPAGACNVSGTGGALVALEHGVFPASSLVGGGGGEDCGLLGDRCSGDPKKYGYYLLYTLIYIMLIYIISMRASAKIKCSI